MIKKTRENQKPTKHRQWKNFFFSPNIWHVNIASLQFYKQMYNNASRICDGEESSSAFFFFSSLLLDGLLFFIFIFLWGVLVLLCTAAAKIYPAHVVSVCYSMVGAAPAVGCGISAHRSWGGKKKLQRLRSDRGVCVCAILHSHCSEFKHTHTHLFPWWVEKMPKDHTAYTETCKWAVSAWVFEVFVFFNRNTHTPTTYALYGFYCLIENILIF